MIILEGPDGTGKSTFAETLCERLGISKNMIVHTGPPPKTEPHLPSGAWTQYLHMLQDKRIPVNAVMDRFMYGELAYGPVFRQDARFTFVHLRMLERIAMSRRAVVLFFPGTDWSLVNWARRKTEGKEMLLDQSQYHKVVDRFTDIQRFAALPSMTVYPRNMTGPDVYDLVKWIEQNRPQINIGGGHGNYAADIMLVGDFSSDSTAVPQSWPAVEYEGPLYTFTEQLDRAGVPEHRLYWVNALTESGNLRQGGWIDGMQVKHVFAFGSAGAAWCEKYSPGYTMFPDPRTFFAAFPFHEHPAAHIIRKKV